MGNLAIIKQVKIANTDVAPRIIDLGIDYRHEDITPEMASNFLRDAYLRTPTLDPRSRDPRAADAYAAVIKDGGWVRNGMPIIFDENGILMDGFRRLEALINAGKTVRMLLAENVRRDTIHTLDQHRRRTFIGILESRNVSYAGDVHRALTKMVRIENGLLLKSNYAPNWVRLELALGANKEIHEAAEIAHTRIDTPEVKSHMPPKTRVIFCFMALKAGHREKLLQFLSDMTDPSVRSDNPARMLEINLTSAVTIGKRRFADADVALALCIKAFTDYINGKSADNIYSWKPDFGGVPLNSRGNPISMVEARKAAPENCGLPMIPGYPGLTNGKVGTSQEEAKLFDGEFTKGLRKAAKSRGDDPSIVGVEITPEVANYFLTFNTGNRKIQKAYVKLIARDITSGNWMVNAQPVAFEGDPMNPEDGPVRLLNGQHRLMACIEANLPIEIPIAIHVDPQAFKTFDMQSKASKSVKTGDERVGRGAAIFQWREDHGLALGATERPTATELEETLQRHQGLLEFVGKVRTKTGSVRWDEISTGGVMAYLLYRTHRENAPLAEKFMTQIASGTGIERGNPIRDIRDEVVKGRTGAQRLSRKDALNKFIACWEKYKIWSEKAKAKADQAEMTLD